MPNCLPPNVRAPKIRCTIGRFEPGHRHDFRHTNAYESAMERVEMPIIQRQLGHTSLATTDRYFNHIAPKQVIDTINKREWRL